MSELKLGLSQRVGGETIAPSGVCGAVQLVRLGDTLADPGVHVLCAAAVMAAPFRCSAHTLV